MPEVINNNYSIDNIIYKNSFHKKLCILNPNLITLIGFIISLFAAFLFYKNNNKYFCYIILLIILRSLADIYDGMIARKCNKISKLGKYLDLLSDNFFIFIFLLLTSFKIDSQYVKYIIYICMLFIIRCCHNCLFTNYYMVYNNNIITLIHDNIMIFNPLFVYICHLIVNNF